MAVRIERADFEDPELAAFLQAHLDDLAPTAPAESRHALDLSTLRMPQIRLWVVYDDDRIIASGALAALEPGHEELKSMRTDPSRRREGTGRRILEHLLNDAGTRGVQRVSLETGSMDFFAAARTLYETAGFTCCPPFADYVDDPNSVFITKRLAD